MNNDFRQKIKEKIKEEAYYHYLQHGDCPLWNWVTAEQEIQERLQFLAFYLHETDINRSPLENWVEAEKLYAQKF